MAWFSCSSPAVERQVESAGAKGLNEQVVGSALHLIVLLLSDSLQELNEPGGIPNPLTSPCQVVLGDVHGDLYTAFPATFLHIEDASDVIRSMLSGIRPEKKGDAVVR